MRLVYLFFFVIGFQFIASGQILEKPPSFNKVLLNKTIQEKAEKRLKLQKYVRNYSDIFRNSSCDSKIEAPTALLAGESVQLCVDTSCLDTALESITLTCAPNQGMTMRVPNTICFDLSINNDAMGEDTVCVQFCDTNGECAMVIFPLEITRPITLPFFDDFAYPGPYPDNRNWMDNNVFVNTTLAYQPPSVGVATFDGIDSGGSPYGGGLGIADYLTSNFIDLEGYSASDNVFLSFWLQRKGFGDKPESADAISLEYKTNNGEWISIATYNGFESGAPSDTLEAFQFYSFKLEEDAFFHKNFQFRFQNVNSRTGVIDLWHLDYIKLEANTNNSSSFPDIAFTQVPQSILKNYTNMPRSHFLDFEAQEMTDTIEATIVNHFASNEVVSNNTAGLEETSTSVAFQEFAILDGGENNFSPGERKTKIRNNPLFNSYLVGIESSFDAFDSLVFTMKYELIQNNQSALATANDSVSYQTILDNFFSYDDGTAEGNIIAQNIGTEIAVKYTANIDDSLRAVQIHFPHIIDDVSGQLFNLKVYVGELDEEAEYQAIFKKPFYADLLFDTLQGYTTYVLFDDVDSLPQAVFIPAGDFYVSWQQVTRTEIPLGFDKNNPEGAKKAFFTTTNGADWNPFPSTLEGALMIRPVVGATTPQNTATSTEAAASISDWMDIYPNPAKDRLYFNLKNGNYADYEIQLFNSLGQFVLQSRLEDQLALDQFQNGLYFLKLRHKKTTEWRTHKFILVK